MKRMRKILVGLITAAALTMSAAVVTACSDNGNITVEVDPINAEYQGVYYLDAADGKLHEIVVTDYSVVYTVNDEANSASYTLTDGGLELTFKNEGKNEVVSATFGTDSVTLSYSDNTTVQLLKKVGYTVTFNAGNETEAVVVNTYNGQKVAKPAQDPVKEGYRFRGWFVDSNYSETFDFNSDVVTGNVELFAKWSKIVATTDFTVTLDVNYGENSATEYSENGVQLEEAFLTPTREGYTFDGWWTSDYDDGEKLSARYNVANGFNADVTLYARWIAKAVTGGKLASPVVNFNATTGTITWNQNAQAMGGYEVIVSYNGEEVVNTTVSTTSYTYADFATAPGGDYTVSVRYLATAEANNSDATTVAFAYKQLAKVTNLEVENGILFYDGVEGADYYVVSVVCGNSAHTHTSVNNGTSLYYDFSNCAMPEGGIQFTVQAYKNGWTASTAEYTYYKGLEAVAGLTYDATTQTVTWNAVSNATNYFVTVNGTTFDNGLNRTFSLKGYALGDIEVAVSAQSKGFYAPEATTATFTKATLATPENVKVLTSVVEEADVTVVSWDPVVGATGYTLTVNGQTYTTTDNTFDLTDALVNATEGDNYTLTITANAEDATQNSLASNAIDIRYLRMGATLTYKSGVVAWAPVAGAAKYGVAVNDGEEVLVTDGSVKANVALTQAGANTIKVRYYTTDDTASAWATVSVYAYKVTAYDNDPTAEKPVANVKYYAYGDKMELPTPTRLGYNFNAWYNLPGGAKDNAAEVVDFFMTEKKDVALYATWTARDITVALNVALQGATVEGGETLATVKYDDTTYTLPLAKSDDSAYVFLGWYTQAGGQGQRVADSDGNATGAWKAVQSTIYAYFIQAFEFSIISETNKTVSCSLSEAGREKFSTVTIPAYWKGYTVTELPSNALKGDQVLTTLYIPDTITSIRLRTFENGAHMSTSKDFSFADCYKLGRVHVYQVMDDQDRPVNPTPTFRSDNGLLIKQEWTGTQDALKVTKQTLAFFPVSSTSKGSTFVIPDGVTDIPSGLFRFPMASTTTVYIPVFAKLVVPNTVRNIGGTYYNNTTAVFDNFYGSFYNLTYLEEVEFLPGGTEPLTIGAGAFQGCTALTKVTFPARLSKIEKDEKLTYIETDIFQLDAALERVDVLQEEGVSGNYYSVDGVLFCKHSNMKSVSATVKEDNRSTLVFVPRAMTFEDGAYVVPDGTQVIGRYAFGGSSTTYAQKNLAKITIPNTVVEIGEQAFYYCNALQEVVFKGDRVNDLELKLSCFSYTAVLETVTFEKGTLGNTGKVMIGEKSFYGSSTYKLANLNWEDGNIYSIGSQAFYYGRMTEIVIPASVREIKANAFQYCNLATSITFLATLKSETNPDGFDPEDKEDPGLTIETGAFRNCTLLTEIVFPVNMKTLSLDCLAGSGISNTSFSVAEGNPFLRQMADGSIYNSDMTELIYLPASAVVANMTFANTLKKISGSAFENSMVIEKVTIPASVEEIGDRAFLGCLNLKEVVFESAAEGVEEAPLTIGDLAFASASTTAKMTLEKFTIPERTVSIGNGAFYYCQSLTGKLVIPANVKFIGDGAFYYCNGFTELEILDGEKDLQIGRAGYAVTTATGTGTARGGYTFYYNQGLTKVTLPSRLKILGNRAFYYDNKITEIVWTNIENSRLEVVGYYCFYYCSELTELTIPAGRLTNSDYEFDATNKYGTSSPSPTSATPEVQGKTDGTIRQTFGINDYAFYYCKKLEKLTLSDVNAVEGSTNKFTLGNYLFYYTTELQEVVLPANLGEGKIANGVEVDIFSRTTPNDGTVVPNYIFGGTTAAAQAAKLAKFSMNTSADGYTTVDGVLYLTDAEGNPETLLVCPMGKTGVVTVPETVKNVKSGAFYYASGITSVVFQKNTDKAADKITVGSAIGSTTTTVAQASVFYMAAGLTSVVFPDTQLEVGDFAFQTTAGASLTLTNVTLPTTQTVSINRYGFQYCAGLTNLTLTNVDRIGEFGFAYCDSFETLDLGTKLTSIGNSAFYGCSKLKSVTIPTSVTEIGKGADSNVFAENELLENVVFRAVENPSKGFEIAAGAFANCVALKTFNVPANLTVIGEGAFLNCENLATVNYAEGCTLKNIRANAFENTALTSISLPASVTSIGKDAFKGCLISEVTIAKGLTDYTAFTTIGTLQAYNVEEGHESFKSVDGVLYNENGEQLLAFPAGKQIVGGVFQVPATVTTIGGSAFEGNATLTSIVIPVNVTAINVGAFKDCTALTSVTFAEPAEGEQVSNLALGNNAFDGTALTEVVLPVRVNAIGTGLFANCSALESADISKVTADVKTLPANIFNSCTALTSVKLPSTLTKLDAGAFYKCSSLKTVDVPESVTELAKGTETTGVFGKCYALESVVFHGAKLTKINDYAFSECRSLKSFTEAEPTYTTNEEGYKVYTMTLPSSLTTIGTYAFNMTSGDVDGRTELTVPAKVTSLGQYAFTYTSITKIDIAATGEIKTFGTYMFYHSVGLEEVVFSGKTVKIQSSNTLPLYTFQYGESLKKIILPSTLVTIPTAASTSAPFAYCNALETIQFGIEGGNPTALKTINNYAFATASTAANISLRDICYWNGTELVHNALPDTVETLGTYAFNYNYGLEEITLPRNAKLTTMNNHMFYYCKNLKKVNIPDTFTKIDTYLFYYCQALEEVVFPDSMVITDIPTYLFYHCDSLKSFEIPATVKTIGNYAFAYTGLESITIPKSVTSIGYYAFGYNYNLTDLQFEDGGKDALTIGYSAFTTARELTKVVFPQRLTTLSAYTTVSPTYNSYGQFYNAAKLEAVYFENGAQLKKFPPYAFYGCTSLKEMRELEAGETAPATVAENPVIRIPESVEEISFGMFYNNASIEKVIVPSKANLATYTSDSTTSAPFYNCTSLKEVVILNPNFKAGASGAFKPNLPGYTFYGSAIETFEVPASIETIANYAFSGMNKLKSVTFAEGSKCKKIGYCAFSGLAELKSVALPASLETISYYSETSTTTSYGAFYNCPKLETVTIDYGPYVGVNSEGKEVEKVGTALKAIPQFLFYKCHSLVDFKVVDKTGETPVLSTKNVIPESVEKIGQGAFAECTSLTDMHVPATVAVIVNGTYGIFDGDTALTAVTFDSAVVTEESTDPVLTVLPDYTFDGCTALTTVTLPTTITEIGKFAFRDTAITSINIPDYVTKIGEHAFAGAASLKTFKIPASLVELGDGAFEFVETFSIGTLDGVISDLTVENNILYNGDKTVLLAVPASFSGAVTIPESVKEIGAYVFYGRNVTAVTIPEGVEVIGNYAFAGTPITGITIPASVKVIGTNAFEECVNLATLDFAARTEGLEVGNYAFSKIALTNITIPAFVTKLGNYAFAYNTALATVNFATRTAVETLEIGTYAFTESAITNVSVPAQVTTMGANVFAKCEKLTSAEVLISASAVPNVFSGCTALESVVLSAEFKSLAANAFDSLTALKSVTVQGTPAVEGKVVLPDGITSIGNYAFRGDALLKDFNLGSSIETLGSYAFQESGITSIVLPEGVASIPTNAFDGCVDLASVTLPDSITSIGTYAFRNCGKLTSIYLSDAITTIGTNAFENTGLTSVVLPKNLSAFTAYMFSGCTDLVEVDTSHCKGALAQTSTTIGQYAFANTAIKKFVFPSLSNPETSTSAYIPIGIFSNCTELEQVTFKSSPYYLYSGAFYNCSKLTKVVGLNATYIYGAAFAGCESLDFVIPTRTTYLTSTAGYSEAFGGNGSLTGVKSISLGDNTAFTYENGLLYKTGATTYIVYGDPAVLEGELELPAGATTTYIYTGAFKGCDKITKVVLPKTFSCSTSYVGLFAECTALEEVDASKIKSTGTGYGLFANCVSLKKIEFPATLTTIYGGTFYNCTSLESVKAPGAKTFTTSVETATTYMYGNRGVFENCYNLKEVKLNLEECTSIYYNMFKNCTSLEEISIGDATTSIYTGAFEGCTALKNVHVGEAVTTIYSRAFANTGLVTIELPGSVSAIQANAFEGSAKLQRITIQESDSDTVGLTIASYAFRGVSPKAQIILPTRVTKIDYLAFAGWTTTNKIYVRADQTLMEKENLLDNTGIKNMSEENQNACIEAFMALVENVVWSYDGVLPAPVEEGESDTIVPEIKDGYWYVGETNTGISADTSIFYVGENGNWWIAGQDTGIVATIAD